jgi:hypothetical protein
VQLQVRLPEQAVQVLLLQRVQRQELQAGQVQLLRERVQQVLLQVLLLQVRQLQQEQQPQVRVRRPCQL